MTLNNRNHLQTEIIYTTHLAYLKDWYLVKVNQNKKFKGRGAEYKIFEGHRGDTTHIVCNMFQDSFWTKLFAQKTGLKSVYIHRWSVNKGTWDSAISLQWIKSYKNTFCNLIFLVNKYREWEISPRKEFENTWRAQ